MIRFVDIRNQGTGYRFAFWDTVVNKFKSFGGDQAWDGFEDLKESITFERKGEDRDYWLTRLGGLCPDWTRDGKEDDLEKWYGED